MTGQFGVLATHMSKPTQIILSCYLGYGKCGVLHFGGMQRLACRAISASAELLVTSMFQGKVRRHSTVQSAVLAGLGAVLEGTGSTTDPGVVDAGPPGPLQALSERLIAAARRGDMDAVAQLADDDLLSVDVADSTGLTAVLAASVRIIGCNHRVKYSI